MSKRIAILEGSIYLVVRMDYVVKYKVKKFSYFSFYELLFEMLLIASHF